MSGNQFDPQSTDAMFAKILANQERDHADREAFREEMRETLAAHGKRIGVLELFVSNLSGKIAVFGAVAGVVSGAIFDFIKDKFSGGHGP